MIELELNAGFWRSLSSEEFKGICDRDGLLTRAQTLRAWQMTGNGHRPPPEGRMRVLLDEATFERWLGERKQRLRPS